MACVALTSLMATIKLQFLQPNNGRVSLDDEASISLKSLFEKLSSLQAFVQEKSGTRELEMKIRDFALEAEDRIEIQLSNFLLAKGTQDQQKAYQQQLHQTLGEAAENAAKLLEKSKETDDKEVVNISGGPVIPWLKHDSASEPSNVMVGRGRDRVLIMDKLIRGSEELKVLSIVGMPGIGKTTLARSVYKNKLVTSHFDVQKWVSMPDVGGYDNVREMLHTLLWAVVSEGEEIKEGRIPVDLAAEKVFKCLRGKRYLIVFDNLPNNEAWDYIPYNLPDYTNGSRIVITTTHFLRRDSWDYSNRNIMQHNMNLLNPEESWTLFCNNPVLKLKEHQTPSIFQKIRSQVVELCEGLPHSIVVVAKRLSKCDNIRQEWKKVQKEIELLGVLDRRALTHTYNQLPQHLKVCFLYFGVFPKRSAIKVKLLIRLWITEGFINPLWYKELESQAYEYLQEFVDRSLILIDSWSSSSGKIKDCRMHSALHSFCVREAQKEGIFCALNTQQLPRGSFSMFANSCRWLSLYTHKFDYYVLLRTNNPRSIFFFQEDAKIYVSFKLLRVLAFVPSSFLQRVPARLHDLVFLRYLSVTEWFEGLDYVVSTNRNLQTLVVSGKESQFGAPTRLPCTIWESPQLQHLELGKSYVIDPPSMDKDKMRTLSWLCPTHCRTGVYCRFPNIEKLEVFVCCSNPIILDNLEYLEHLKRLSISVSFGCVVTLPKPSMFPSQLNKLRLNGTNLSEGDLEVIGMLPQLEVLKLENAFHGEVWDVEEGLFVRLKFLLLDGIKLEQWRVGEYSFQYLKHLVLRFCYRLKNIPKVMVDIFTLESIELQSCCHSLISSAKRIQEHRWDFGLALEIKIK
ncbi:putative late blight resistance protein homolog R1A-10 [Ipomoea triloba]|uniref:putative late blight resistance protein homolog R1A-10 n=1 Tax=Ipomoea triloba TaxID=35885 RepID=UPI00125E3D74|nr:putative late blight resistance protein homolog R1A-10 [Ipomoea triloba]